MKFIKNLQLLKNRRAINTVISNVILVAAVITVGFVVLAWAQSESIAYNNQYSSAIQSDTDQLRERLVFEYIHYDKATGILTIYLMNSGTIDNINITNVYVNNVEQGAPTLHLLNNNAETSSLDIGQEGYFSVPPLLLALGKNYPIVIVTGRGSSFAATFAT